MKIFNRPGVWHWKIQRDATLTTSTMGGGGGGNGFAAGEGGQCVKKTFDVKAGDVLTITVGAGGKGVNGGCDGGHGAVIVKETEPAKT